jgi:hypothetical protein
MKAVEFFRIEALDWDNGLASAQLTEVEITPAGSQRSKIRCRIFARNRFRCGDDLLSARLVRVNRQTTDYRVIKRYTHEVMGRSGDRLPIQHFKNDHNTG